jgi:hypothetical protein
MGTTTATWTADDGDWFVGGNWQEPNPNYPPPPQYLHYVPGSDNDASIPNNTGTNTRVTVSYDGTDTVNTLGSVGSVTLNITGGSLTVLNGGYFDTIDLASLTSFDVSGGIQYLSGGSFSGIVTGAGTLVELNGQFDIEAGVTIDVATWTLSYQTGSATVSVTTLYTDLTYGGDFNIDSPYGNAAVLELNGHTFTLSGTGSLTGVIDGAGTFLVTGSTTIGGSLLGYDPTHAFAPANAMTFENQGSVSQDGFIDLNGTILNDASATWTFTAASAVSNEGATFDNDGTIHDAASGISEIDGAFVNNGSIAIDANAVLNFADGAETLYGTVSGAGELDFGFAHDAIIDTDSLTVGAIYINGGNGGGTVSLGESLGYAGTFTFTDQFGYFELAGYTLTLSGNDTFATGAVDGPGTIDLTGTATIDSVAFGYDPTNGYASGNTVAIENAGSLTQAGNISLNGTIANQSAGTWDVVGNLNIVNEGTAGFDNAGLLEKTAGTGIGTLYGAFGNTGTVDVQTGTLYVSGAGGTISGLIEGTDFGVRGGGTYDLASTLTLTVSELDIQDGGTDVVLESSGTYNGTIYTSAPFTTLTIDINGFDLGFGGTVTLQDADVVGPGTVTLSGPTTILDSTLSDLAQVTLSGTATVGNSEVLGPGTLSFTNDATIYSFTAGDDLVTDITGTVDQAGYVQFGATSTDTLQVTVESGGTYDLTTNDWTNNPNTNDDGEATFTNDGLLEKTVGTGTSTFFLDVVNNGTIQVNTGVLDLESVGTSDLDGVITGAGELVLGRNAFLIDTTTLTVSSIYSGAGSVTLQEDLAYANTFTQGGGNIYLNGHDLTLSGTVTLDYSAISGLGTLTLSKTATIYNYTVGTGTAVDITGTVDQAGYVQYGATPSDTVPVTIESGATYDLTTNDWTNNPNTNDDGEATFTNDGLLEKTVGTGTSTFFLDVVNNGTIQVNTGVLDLESVGTSTLNGVITGAGGLTLGRNAFLIDTTTLTVSSIYSGAGSVTLQEDLTYDNPFTQGGGGIHLNGHDLTLGGTVTLGNSAISGVGTLTLSKTATIYNYTVGTGTAVDITGSVYQAGYVQYGATSTDAIQVTIESGGTYDLTTNDSTNNVNGNDNGEATFTVDGLLEKTAGTGTSTFFTAVVNAGTILGESGTLNFAQSLTNNGLIEANNGAIGIAGNLLGTGTLTLTDNASITLNGSVSAGQTVRYEDGSTTYIADIAQFSGTIANFGTADTIDLTNVAYDSAGTAYVGIDNILTITESGTSHSIHMSGDYTGLYFHLASDNANGTDITANTTPCYLPGTRIATDRGEIAVEALRVGDTVVTLSGARRRLCWIGTGKALATRGKRGPATPIIVRKSALADNVPYADLRITKGHSLYLDGVLIPAEYLVNHHSICWDDRAQEVTVFHLELDTHDVLLANGAAAESYRDDGNRWLFQNANPGWAQPPKPPCAPVLTGGSVVDAIWRRLLDRAGPRASLPLTDDPDLHLLVDGVRRDPSIRQRGLYVFELLRRPASARLVSRAAAPQELGLARDPRLLGVAVRRIALLHAGRLTAVTADDAALADGFHAFEADNAFRWTDGDAVVPAALFDGMEGPARMEVVVGCTTTYRDEGGAAPNRAAA